MTRPTAVTTMPRLRTLTAMRDREHTLSVVRIHLPDIARNGTLELRYERGRKPSYSVRFRAQCPDTGVTRQHRVNIGDDPELHDVVRTVIVARVRQHMQAKAAKTEAARQRAKARADELAFIAGLPGSRRKQRTIRRAYRDSLASGEDITIEMMRIISTRPRRKRPGRPLASRLW